LTIHGNFITVSYKNKSSKSQWFEKCVGTDEFT